MREQPSNLPPAIVPQVQSNIITQVREYQLITPLFGGGVNPREADELTTVRATEVRGHLRFWWRACRGGQHGSLEEMKKAEDAIWGKAYEKKDEGVQQEQTVQIVIEQLEQGKAIKPYRIERGRAKAINGIPGYAAFPLQPDREATREPNPFIPDVQENVSFRLTISFPKDRINDIEASLWAWETFGGIGARTRRGFGALHLLQIDGIANADIPTASKAKTWIEEKFSTFVINGIVLEGVPQIHKTSSLYISHPFSNPMAAWDKLIKTLSGFRQFGRLERPSRTIWPEADAIRTLKGGNQRSNTHSPINKFPKAQLGLPIIYHFIGDDPKEQTLQGATKGAERLASSLILCPLLCKNNQTVGIALLLDGPRIPPGGVVLAEKDAPDKPTQVQTMLTPEEAQKIPVLQGETDVLQAFMKYLERNI